MCAVAIVPLALFAILVFVSGALLDSLRVLVSTFSNGAKILLFFGRLLLLLHHVWHLRHFRCFRRWHLGCLHFWHLWRFWRLHLGNFRFFRFGCLHLGHF